MLAALSLGSHVPAAPPAEHRVAFEKYTMLDTVRTVLHRLDDGEEHQLAELWMDMPFRRARLITFLAVLELMKLNYFRVRQERILGEIEMIRNQF